MRTKIRLLALFTCAHVVLTLGASLYAMTDLARFDNPELPRTLGMTTAGIAANVLMSPGLLVWTSWASKNLPNAVEWIVFIANSALWGAAGVMIAGRVSGGRDAPLRDRESF